MTRVVHVGDDLLRVLHQRHEHLRVERALAQRVVLAAAASGAVLGTGGGALASPVVDGGHGELVLPQQNNHAFIEMFVRRRS